MGENNWKEDKRRRGGEGGERVNMPVIRRSSKEKKKEKVAETLHNTPTGVYGFPGRKHQARWKPSRERTRHIWPPFHKSASVYIRENLNGLKSEW